MKKLGQVNILFAFAFILILSAGVFYYLLFSKLQKKDIDKLLEKSLSEYVLPESMRYEKSELKIRNSIEYKVLNLELHSFGFKIFIDEIKFDIPFLALFSKRRIRSYINKLTVQVEEPFEQKFVSKKEYPFIGKNKARSLQNELSLSVKKVEVKRRGLTYELKNTFLRNINHSSFTHLSTQVIMSNQSELISGLKFWGEIKFRDLFEHHLNLDGYIVLLSNDERLEYLADKKLKVTPRLNKQNSFFVSNHSKEKEVSFEFSIADSKLQFDNINIQRYETHEFPRFIKQVIDCSFDEVNVFGQMYFDKFIKKWSPNIKLSNECAELSLTYKDKYKWHAKSKNIDGNSLRFESLNFSTDEVLDLYVDLKDSQYLNSEDVFREFLLFENWLGMNFNDISSQTNFDFIISTPKFKNFEKKYLARYREGEIELERGYLKYNEEEFEFFSQERAGEIKRVLIGNNVSSSQTQSIIRDEDKVFPENNEKVYIYIDEMNSHYFFNTDREKFKEKYDVLEKQYELPFLLGR